jgi:hypothetical protein
LTQNKSHFLNERSFNFFCVYHMNHRQSIMACVESRVLRPETVVPPVLGYFVDKGVHQACMCDIIIAIAGVSVGNPYKHFPAWSPRMTGGPSHTISFCVALFWRYKSKPVTKERWACCVWLLCCSWTLFCILFLRIEQV